MTIVDALILVAVGIASGFLNVLAGGGSLITLPVLIFMGMPSAVANGTNRLGIFMQNVFAVRGFKSKGVRVFPFAWWVAISACAGALVGALIAVDISDKTFNRILAIIMIGVMLVTVLKPKMATADGLETFSRKRNALSITLFFFIGIYGGFIQAGIGFLKIAALTLVHGLALAKVNSIKVFVALCYTTIALIVFIWMDLIWWQYGLMLAVGNAIGGWFTSRWSVGVPDKYVRAFLLVTVTALAVKLWFFG